MVRHLTFRNVLAVALFVRVGALIALHDGLTVDTDGYQALADNLVQHRVFGIGEQPTAYRPPLYPLVLAATNMAPLPRSAAIGIAHLLMGCVTVVLVYRLAQRWYFSARAASFAALLVAVDPILLSQSAQIMSETLATLCVVASLLSLTLAGPRPWAILWAVSGGWIALSSYCRPNFLVWLLAILVFLSWLELRTTRQFWKPMALFLGAAATLAPWTVRNWHLLDRPIIATTHGGYTLLLGNNPSFFAYLRQGHRSTPWEPGDTIPARHQSLSEIEYDTHNYRSACQAMRQQPVMTAYASLVRLRRLWGLLPQPLAAKELVKSRATRYLIGIWNAAIFAAALFGCYATRDKLLKPPWLWGLLLCVSWTAVHLFFWSNLRMRAPLVPVIALLAADGVATWMRRNR